MDYVDRPRRSVEIASRLREEITEGVFNKERRLPTLEELATTFGASKNTVREALAQLETEGLVVTRHGKGTSLTPRALRLLREDVDPEANFRQWLKLVGLDAGFPALKEIGWREMDQKVYLRHQQEMIINNDIIPAAAAAASAQAVVNVVFPRGHGCTTLFNYVFNKLTPQAPDATNGGGAHLVIPVRITWSRLGDYPGEFRDNLAGCIRTDAILQLTHRKWRRMINQATYAKLIDAVGHDDEDPELNEHIDRVDRALGAWADRPPPLEPGPPEPFSDELRELLPTWADARAEEILSELGRAEIKTLLMIDLSPGARRDAVDLPIGDLIGAIKDILDWFALGNAPMSEMYFLDQAAADRISRDFTRSDQSPITFPYFTKADFFGILLRHYPAFVRLVYEGGGRGENTQVLTRDLAGVISPYFLDQVAHSLSRTGQGFGDVSLHELSAVVREVILEIMDVPWSEVSYHLIPSRPD